MDMKQNTSNKGKNDGRGRPAFNFMWIYAAITVVFIGLMFFDGNVDVKEVSWSEFKNEYLFKGYVEKVWYEPSEDGALDCKAFLNKEAVQVLFPENTESHIDGPHLSFRCGSEETFRLAIKEVTEQYDFVEPETNVNKAKNWSGYFWNIFPIVLLVVFWLFIMRRMGGQGGGPGGVFNVGKSKAKLYDKETEINVNFDAVAGLAEAKQEVAEIVDFLKNPSKYTDLGGKIPKGALLVGPPGTGKTLLAKAVAGEAHVPFFSISGSDFVEMFVGVGASRVRDLFRQAKEKAPCIIFIDEIDAIGRARGKHANFNSNDERENTLNQLLTEMDGFGNNSGVIILAATNRADILDKALLRAGRFDRQIQVDIPDLNERVEIFNVHLKPLKCGDDLDVQFLARQTPGFSGADIANVCNEAALIAARRGEKTVVKQHFLDAVDRIVGGLEKKTRILTKSEKRSIAYHEAGHAAIGWLLEHAHPLVKVTIVPRGKALGAAWYLPEERQLTNREQLLDEMCALLGGRAAEEVVFGKVSTGALNDLERVTRQAYAMVSYFGMSSAVGNVSFFDSTGENSFGFSKPYSEKTAELIDQEAARLITEQYERAKSLLLKYREQHEQLAELLIEREIIFSDDVKAIFGERPWPSRSDELLIEESDKPKDIPESTPCGDEQ